MNTPAVDIVTPALNEAAALPAYFDALEPFRADGTVRRVVIADNGSTDDTPDLARARGAEVVREPRRGYGAACLAALAHLRAHDGDGPPDIVVFLDADLSDDPAALPDLLAPLHAGAADITIGSRVARAEPGALNPVQRFGNALACTLIRLATGRRYTDLGPFRAATWRAFEQLDMQDRTWGWTVELQMKAALLGLRVVEVDVPYRRRRFGTSKISGTIRGVVTAGTKIIVTIGAIWWKRRALRARATSLAEGQGPLEEQSVVD